MTMQGAVDLQNTSTEPVVLGGDFVNENEVADPATWPGAFEWSGVLRMEGGSPQMFELADRDIGQPKLIDENSGVFFMSIVDVAAGADVTFIDAFDNDGLGQIPCTEALYVDQFRVGDGATVTIQDGRVYFNQILVGQGATIRSSGCTGQAGLTTPFGDPLETGPNPWDPDPKGGELNRARRR